MDLGMCREGDLVTILKIRGSGMVRKRLLEMGILRGAQIRIVKYAPLHDPMEIIVGTAHVSLRVSEASMIEVQRFEFREFA